MELRTHIPRIGRYLLSILCCSYKVVGHIVPAGKVRVASVETQSERDMGKEGEKEKENGNECATVIHEETGLARSVVLKQSGMSQG